MEHRKNEPATRASLRRTWLPENLATLEQLKTRIPRVWTYLGWRGARPKREPAVVKDCTRQCFCPKELQILSGCRGFDGWFRQAFSFLPPRREDECKDC